MTITILNLDHSPFGNYIINAKMERIFLIFMDNFGRKYSVYKNDKQIAWWDKQAVSWFNGDNYTIIADNDADYELIIAFCLIIDNQYNNNDNSNTVTFDIGNIGGQVRKFNTDWKPNDRNKNGI